MLPNGNMAQMRSTEFALRSLPLVGVGVVLAIAASPHIHSMRTMWALLALEVVLGIAAIAAWLVKA